MKFFYLLLALLLVGCHNETVPGQFTGTIMSMRYNPYYQNINTIVIFSKEYGNVKIFDTPYFESLSPGQEVVVVCDYLKNKDAERCNILGRPKKDK